MSAATKTSGTAGTRAPRSKLTARCTSCPPASTQPAPSSDRRPKADPRSSAPPRISTTFSDMFWRGPCAAIEWIADCKFVATKPRIDGTNANLLRQPPGVLNLLLILLLHMKSTTAHQQGRRCFLINNALTHTLSSILPSQSLCDSATGNK